MSLRKTTHTIKPILELYFHKPHEGKSFSRIAVDHSQILICSHTLLIFNHYNHYVPKVSGCALFSQAIPFDSA